MSDRWERDIHCHLGLPFDAVSLDGTLRILSVAASRRQSCFISTPNLNFVVAAQNEAAFKDSVLESDLSLVDGMPLVWTAKLLGIPIPERVAGSTVFESLRRQTGQTFSVYFFGGMDGVAKKACESLNSEPSGLVCVGYGYPGFGSVEEMSTEATIAKINFANPDFLVVSLGAKKGQAWIRRNRERLSAPLVSHLGAVVNFVAGNLQRAPVWMQRTGLEWLWRIFEEPGLWRRYLEDGSTFLRLIFTRVFPHALYLRGHQPSDDDIASARIAIRDEEQVLVMELSGAWVRKNLRPIREHFASASVAGKNVRIDLGNVSFVDSAFLGLVMLLAGDLSQRGRAAVMVNASDDVRRIVRYSCAESLFAPEMG